MSTTIDPTTRRVPPLGGLNTTVLRIELKRDAAQPAHDHLHAGVPGRAVLRVRLGRRTGTKPSATATSRPTS